MKALYILVSLSVFSLGPSANLLRQTDQSVNPVLSDSNCSDGWRITGYYTPVETDFTTPETREIEIRGVGTQSFNADFLRTIFDDEKGYGEGWGKTRFGWYLGEYNGRWHKADAPLDANDRPLEPNTVAVDNSVVPRGSTVEIPNLPGAFGQKQFRSTDVGVSVHGKHIDVYTGEGKAARRQMNLVTFEEDWKGLQKVCVAPPEDVQPSN